MVGKVLEIIEVQQLFNAESNAACLPDEHLECLKTSSNFSMIGKIDFPINFD